MLPLVLGGVALAATGYGIAKLFEDDCDCSFGNNHTNNENPHDEQKDEMSPETQEMMESITIYEKAKSELYRVSLKELETALGELNNFTRDVGKVAHTVDFQYNFTTIKDDIKEEFEKYAEILTMTQKYIDTNLDKLDTIIIDSNDFTAYGDDDKEFITNLENIRHLVEVATTSNMTLDGENISREVKRAFAKLETMIK